MKSACVALALFCVLVAGIFVNAYFLDKTVTASVNDVSSLENYANPSPKSAESACEKAVGNWEKREKYITVFVNRNETAAISVLYAQLMAAAKEDMDGDFQETLAGLVAALDQLENISSFKLRYFL